MLKLLHTADWHIGRTFGLFDESVANRLAHDRLSVVERIFTLADRHNVDAVLCAGDLFDEPCPDSQWWRPLAEQLAAAASRHRPIVLLPGNHDPLGPESVYAPGHEFRSMLPDHVHVVDSDKFQQAVGVGGNGMVYASPCTSRAGDRDLAMALPGRETNDSSIRIGMVHGSAVGQSGSGHYPISVDAPLQRGFDYLAIGNTHDWHQVSTDGCAPILYPGTPEPTSFAEKEAGYVALVNFSSSGVLPVLRQERVNRWFWREETITSMEALAGLASEDLKTTVLRLRLDLTVDMLELEALESTLSSLKGSASIKPLAGALICDRSRLRVNVAEWSIQDLGLPATIVATIERLQGEAGSGNKEQSNRAQRALLILRKMLNESVQSAGRP